MRPTPSPFPPLAGAVLATAALLLAPNALGAQQAPSPVAGRSTVYAPHGVVATSQPLASAAGLRMLEAGGNAVDAAVAASAVLSLVEPHMTGPGGDLFALLWDPIAQRLVGLDASGFAGSRMSAQALRAAGLERVPYQGPGSVTVPGAVAGWGALLERYGSMPLADVLAPAIALAEDGFPLSPIIARQWAAHEDLLRRDPGASATFLVGEGRAPRAGELFRNPELASSLRVIARAGPAAMYGGELGRRIVEGLEPMGGYLTLDDMTAMRVRWVEPISIDFRGWTVWEMPPATQGVAALEMLELLEPLDLENMGHNSAAYLHTLIEAKKLAFADMGRYVADPSAMKVRPEALLDSAFVTGRRALIDSMHAADRPDAGEVASASETVYLAVADREGRMVSFIHSNYEYFGSGVAIPGTGFVLQNRGAGFTLEEGHPNQVAPRKRPFHTLIPGFVTRDGQPYAAFGVMGGSMQPQGHVQLLLNLLVFGMEPQEAVDAARFRHLGGLRVAVENVTPELRAALQARGHDVTPWKRTAFGGAQLVIRLPGGWAAASDARKDGLAIGY